MQGAKTGDGACSQQRWTVDATEEMDVLKKTIKRKNLAIEQLCKEKHEQLQELW